MKVGLFLVDSTLDLALINLTTKKGWYISTGQPTWNEDVLRMREDGRRGWIIDIPAPVPLADTELLIWP